MPDPHPPASFTSPVPVRWDPGRDARGAAPDRGVYTCPERGCPVVSASLRVIVAHVRAHRAEDEAALPDARERALDRIRPGARWPDPDELDEPAPEPEDEPAPGPEPVDDGEPEPVDDDEPDPGAEDDGEPGADARLCACGCGQALPPDSRPYRRFIDGQHRKRQNRRDERADHRELKAGRQAAAQGTTVPPWERHPGMRPAGGVSVTEVFRSIPAVTD